MEGEAVIEYNPELISVSHIVDAVEEMGFEAAPKLSNPQNLLKVNAIDVATPARPPDLGPNKNLKLAIEGMHCKSCVRKIEDNMREVPGLVHISVSLESKNADVTFSEDSISENDVAQKIADLGFQVTKTSGKIFQKKVSSQQQQPAILLTSSDYSNSPNTKNIQSQDNLGVPPVSVIGAKGIDNIEMTVLYSPGQDNDVKRCFIEVKGMTCASCVNNIERHIGKNDAVNWFCIHNSQYTCIAMKLLEDFTLQLTGTNPRNKM